MLITTKFSWLYTICVGYFTVINSVLYFCIYQLLDNKNMTAEEYTIYVFISGYAVLHACEDPFHCILKCICRHTSLWLSIIFLQVFRVNKQLEQYMKGVGCRIREVCNRAIQTVFPGYGLYGTCFNAQGMIFSYDFVCWKWLVYRCCMQNCNLWQERWQFSTVSDVPVTVHVH